MNSIELLFWISLATVAYVFVGYPLAIALAARLKPALWQRRPWEPRITIVIAAYNEEVSIVRKVRNLLALDYPDDRLEILLGSDGSTDGTVARLRALAGPRIRIFVFDDRQGKPAMLNKLVPNASGEIVVLADARQEFDPQAMRVLVQAFADPLVGAVTGELILTRKEEGNVVGEGSGFYWRYEKFIRWRESLVDSTIGVTGAIYAIRRELFEAIPEDTIVDDLLIPLRIARRGYRVVFERHAYAYDVAPATRREEFTRKVRTLAGNFQLFARERWLFNPLRNRLWWQTMSHKALRLLIAPLQVATFATNVALAAGSAFYQFTLLAQIVFYSGAIAGCLLSQTQKRPAAVTFPYIFCLLSWATVVAFLRSISRRQRVTWEKAAPDGAAAGEQG